ncbi:hypothetical protein [Tepidicella baoligensis]|nr:hypothetical protein [Tepidicella baoligensis]
MPPIPVNPELLTWARERARLDTLALVGRVQSNARMFQGGNP